MKSILASKGATSKLLVGRLKPSGKLVELKAIAAMVILTGCGSGLVPVVVAPSLPPQSSAQTPLPGQLSALTPVVVTPVIPTPSQPRYQLGMNVSTVAYWGGDRSLSNLLVGGEWVDPSNGWNGLPADRVDGLGYPLSVPSQGLNKLLTPPAGVLGGAGEVIRCSWTGTGELYAGGGPRETAREARAFEFFWPKGSLSDRVWLHLARTSATDPVRNLDCREKDAARAAVFAPEFLDSLRPYKVLRFLDWSQANANPATLSWGNRAAADSINQIDRGVALEHQIALANTTGAAPWFNIAWNADEDYVRRMAETVKAGVPAGRQVYVEMSNEVWNYQFAVAAQSEKEGLAQGLSDDRFVANLRRYADKTSWAMKIWAQVFADRPGQLVRVAATQHDNPWTAEMVLSWKDTAANVDALATAPYFGHDFFSGSLATATDETVLMSALAGQARQVLVDKGMANAAVAKTYSKRYIAYEAGQHIIAPNSLDRVTLVNRSVRMYDIYKAFLADWRARFGDTIMLYNATGSISPYGAWGTREYAGQPLNQTPKRRAAIDSAG